MWFFNRKERKEKYQAQNPTKHSSDKKTVV